MLFEKPEKAALGIFKPRNSGLHKVGTPFAEHLVKRVELSVFRQYRLHKRKLE
jgi:hypothetical protein